MKKILKMLGLIILYVLAYFAVFKTVCYVWYTFLINNSVIGDWINSNQLGTVIANDVCAFPLFAILVYFIKKRSILEISQVKCTNSRNAILSILIGVGMSIFLINFLGLSFVKEIPKYSELIDYIYRSDLLVFAGFVIIGTFFKEVLFRGLIFNELAKAMPLVLAILLDAVLYGALFFELNPPLTIFGILGNIVVVLIYYKAKSLWAPYLAQATNNICMYFMINVSGDFFDGFRILGLILSTAIIGVSLYLLYFSKQKGNSASNSVSMQ